MNVGGGAPLAPSSSVASSPAKTPVRSPKQAENVANGRQVEHMSKPVLTPMYARAFPRFEKWYADPTLGTPTSFTRGCFAPHEPSEKILGFGHNFIHHAHQHRYQIRHAHCSTEVRVGSRRHGLGFGIIWRTLNLQYSLHQVFGGFSSV